MNNLTLSRLLPWATLLVVLATATNAAAQTCGSQATPIAQVQGDGEVSPMVGQWVTVEGIMTLDSRHAGGFQGFYLQQADHETDGNPTTSEALFVYTRRKGGHAGHRVRVSGQVKEFHQLTELTHVKALRDCGPAQQPAATDIALPWPDSRPPENLENMRVTISEPLTVTGHFNLDRFGELILANNDQLVPTEIMAPGDRAEALSQHQRLHRLVLDDGLGVRNPRPVPWPEPSLSANNTVRTGDRVSQLAGILDYRFGAWRLQPESSPVFHSIHRRPEPPTRDSATNLRVITLNLGNYFNGQGGAGGFPTARGAGTAEQFARQTARLVTALTRMDGEVIAVTELENDGYGADSAIAQLTRSLGRNWAFVVAADPDGNDAIRSALLYRSDRVTAVGSAHRLSRGESGWHGRSPIAQEFRPHTAEHSVRVIVPHLKSKACRGATGTDRDQKDGQGCYANRRMQASKALSDWANTLPTPERLAGTLITGDLNSYAREQPIHQLEGAGYTNTVRHFHPCDMNQCPYTTFRFKGRRGSLDYSFASAGLLPRVTGAWSWAINAEEPPALGYQGPISVPGSQPWRSSDHNPIITDLAL